MAESRVIAIVDDDESVRESLKNLLRSAGFEAMTFPSAADFLKANCPPATACLLLDLQMPGINGLELQRQLAAMQCRIPIIFVTAHGNEADRTQALQGGAIDFLRKPFSEDDLFEAVHSALSLSTDT